MSLVEFSLVFPLVIFLLMGMIDFGFAFNEYNNLRQGTRDGARQAVVGVVGASSTCTQSYATTGANNGTDSNKLICLTKARIGLKQNNLRIKIKYDGGYAIGGSLLVCAMYPLSSRTKLLDPFLKGKVIKTFVDMRVETTASITELEEVALSGTDWTWCKGDA